MANSDDYPPVVLVYWNSKHRIRFMRETTKRYKAAGFERPQYEYTYEPVPTQHDQLATIEPASPTITTSQAVGTAQTVEDEDDDLHSTSDSLLATFQPRKDRRSTLSTSGDQSILVTPSASASPMLKSPVVLSVISDSESEEETVKTVGQRRQIKQEKQKRQHPKPCATAANNHDGDAAALKEQWASEIPRESESSSADEPLRKRQKLGSREPSNSGPNAARQPFEPIHSVMKTKSMPTAVVPNKVPDTRIPQQPAWYSAMGNPNGRGNYSVTIDNLFGELKSAIKNCEAAAIKGQPLPEVSLKTISHNIHKAFFAKFDNDKDAKMALRKNRLLHNETGLPRLFSTKWLSDLGFKADQPGYSYPFHIIVDAKELYTKWWMESFDTSLYRGILPGTPKNVKLNRPATSNRLDPNYPGRMEGKFHGNVHLLNGQWWPHQLCALRDGAHNSAQGGIAGNITGGAWSVIVAGGHYDDVDKGDVIEYCGTEGTADHPTDVTRYLLKSVENGEPVRVIRSERCKNPVYAPAKGYRYDGLYKVVSSKILKPEKSHHIFKLVRLEGQDPIRYRGDECRPTQEEIVEYNKEQAEREYRTPAEQSKGKKKAV